MVKMHRSRFLLTNGFNVLVLPGLFFVCKSQYLYEISFSNIHIVYVIDSAAYWVLFTSCLCQKPSLARTSLVRVFDTNNS